MLRSSNLFWFAWIVWLAIGPQSPVLGRTVEIVIPTDQAPTPLRGRLFLFCARQATPEPRLGPNWFRPEPFFARDLDAAAGGMPLRIDNSADGFPASLDALPAGRWHVQAVLHLDHDSPFPGVGVGNLYSPVTAWEVEGGDASLQLTLDRRVEPAKFDETPWRREVVLRSERLSRFHGREVVERAAVVLPSGYDDAPQRRYPVLYVIPGFGGSHRDALRLQDAPPPAEAPEVDMIRVYLSGRTEWGHHVFANSATNGPRGASLVEELIPHIDQTFRTIPQATARFLTGHSSGGWSSLWLQVSYPETFGGVWSTAPDPVDFRDYQQVDLYADPPQNMYRTPADERRPIARRGLEPVLWYDDFTRMDDVLLRGGQLRSFEAVFSPVDEQGIPRRMYDRRTGTVDPRVAKAWEAYDIRLKLERGWPELGPKLREKLHVFMGTQDTFYLEGAVVRLKESLAKLGSDARIELVDGADHSSLMTTELRARLRREMGEQFRRHHTP